MTVKNSRRITNLQYRTQLLVITALIACAGNLFIYPTTWQTSKTNLTGFFEANKDQAAQKVFRVQSVERMLDKADQAVLEAVERSISPVRDCFTKANSQLGAFSDAALSWKSKRLMLWDALPGTSNDHLEKYLKNSFRSHVLSEHALSNAIEQSAARFQQELRDIENQLLVQLSADLVDFPDGLVVVGSDGTLCFDEDKYLQLSQQFTHTDSLELVGSTTVSASLSMVMHRAILAAAARLATSGGILGAGASSSTLTMGVSFAAAIVIDWVVSKIWNWFSDPRGRLIELLQQNLTEIEKDLLGPAAKAQGHGSNDCGSSGLRSALRCWATQRNDLRRKLILKTFQE